MSCVPGEVSECTEKGDRVAVNLGQKCQKGHTLYHARVFVKAHEEYLHVQGSTYVLVGVDQIR